MVEEALLQVQNIKKYFDLRSSFLESIFSRDDRYLKAVDGVSFDIPKGKIFGLVGESGCGKTTTGRLIMNSIKPTDGKIFFDGIDLGELKDPGERKHITTRMQMMFQDPYEYLSPWITIKEALAEPLTIHNLVSDKEEQHQRIMDIMETVDLTPQEMILPKYPYELSGGQRQRVVIARALLLNPEFVVADEPVSMLDISIRVGILNLLLELREKFGLTLLFITHDIAVSRYMCDNIGVMYLGRMMEHAPSENIIRDPVHPYTKALISAVPVPDPNINPSLTGIKGRVPSGTDLPSGCRFHPRCPVADDNCRTEDPKLVEVGKDHYVACHNI
jgi:peptide/nickel transport system ATP-binding protein